jgi:hypothetical protein
MASREKAAANLKLELITRKEIGDRLRGYNESRLQLHREEKNSCNCLPIDCFILQLSYSFRKWINTLEIQQSVEKDITAITDEFLLANSAYGEWFKVDPKHNWPLTYFLDAEKDKKRKICQKDEAWFEFEEYLNKNVRQNLRKKLKEEDPSFRDMPVILMRACIYVRDDDSIL